MALTPRLRTWTFRRSGSMSANPNTFAQKSTAFAAAALSRFNSVSLIATRDDKGVHGYLVSGDWQGMDTAALNLAHSVGAKVERVDTPPDLASSAAKVVGRLHYIHGESGGLVQAGADPAEVVRTLAQSMPPGSWVGAAIRRPSAYEKSRWFEYLKSRPSSSQSHHTRQTNFPVIATIYAATDSRAGTRSLLNQVAGTLPGFDMNVGTQIPTRLTAAAVPWILPLLAVASTFAPEIATVIDPEVGANLAKLRWADLIVPAVNVAAALSVALFFGIIPSRWSKLRKAVRRGHLPRPYHRAFRARKGTVADYQHRSEMGEYPLDNRSFMVAPHLLTTLVAPHAGALSGSSSTRSRAVPHLMTTRIGPLVGHSEDQPVHLSARDAQHGISLVGRPGSGKSILMQNLFAWSLLERTRPSGKAGFPGAHDSLIAFEPKLDGAQAYLDWANTIGDVVRVVEVANPTGEAIDLFGVPGTVAERAEFLTEALRYAFDDGAIQGASAEALRAVLAAGLVITDDMVDVLHRGPGGADPITFVDKARSPIYYAHVLLGAVGDTAAVALAAQVELAAKADIAAGRTNTDVALAHGRLAPIFNGRTPAARATYCQAPRNKLDALASVEHFFGPARFKHTWRDVLTNHRAIVILTGLDSAGHMMSTTAEKLMSSLLMYSLRDAIERNCTGWETQNRWVSVFVDELSMIAGNDPEIITWLKNRGRSYGVRPVFATQYPTQLNAQVREAFLSFSNLITYTLDNPEIARDVVADLSGDGTEWTVSDVLELAPFHATVRANVDRQRQPAFSFKAAYFSATAATREEFIAAQGYDGRLLDDADTDDVVTAGQGR